MRYVFISLALFAFAAGLVATAMEFRAGARISVIILTVESTRLDAIGPENTPALWRIAGQGTRFTRHRTASAWTGANIVSILTGLSAFRHGIHGRDVSIPAAWHTPLERLAAQGWRIGGLQPFMLTEGFRNLGLAVTPGEDLFGWLARRARGGEPFVLWYHYLDTHLPYEAAPGLPPPTDPAAARARLVRTKPAIPHDLTRFEARDIDWLKPLYHHQFRVFDRWFGDFWGFLENSGLLDRTIVVLTTDHGEELLERGRVGHASTTRAGHLYDEIARIPLIVWLPPSLRAGPQPATIATPSSHLDIMPTLFARLGIAAPPNLAGRDLFDLPAGRAWQAVTSRAGFAEPDPARIERFAAARVEGDWKLHLDIVRPGAVTRTALHDLARDPGEQHNLAPSEPERTARMTRVLMAEIAAMRVARPKVAGSGRPTTAPAAAPRWLFPAASGTLNYAALPSPLRLRWRGAAGATYRLQYQVGTGPLAFGGEIAVEGPAHDFGPIARDYWVRYIVPYAVIRIRVGPAGRDGPWSPWLTIEMRE